MICFFYKIKFAKLILNFSYISFVLPIIKPNIMFVKLSKNTKQKYRQLFTNNTNKKAEKKARFFEILYL